MKDSDIDTLRPKEAAERLGVCVNTIRRLRKRGKFVPAIKLTDVSLGFRVSDIERWQREREGI